MIGQTGKKQYIIGAGFAGQMIAEDIARKKIFGRVVAFLDDDPNLIGSEIDGIPVLGPIDKTIPILGFEDGDEAIIAMPSTPNDRIRTVYDGLRKKGVSRIKILPAISQIVDGNAHFIQTREIDPLDILGRTPVIIPLKESLAYLRGKRVLITGAGGSIGSELARQLLSGGAQRLYLLGHGENSIYLIDRELRTLQREGVGEKATIVPIIGDLKDREYTRYIVSKLRCDVIFHCAAYKHVPLMEENPVAVIENNVFGTKNLLDAALENGVHRFVLISTDKAVSPVSVYGVSKMLCEKLVLDAARQARVQDSFMFVRFGNVLGSRGSVLPVFMDQLKTGSALTVTHPEMKRYFMTIPEACSLVLETGGVGQNGSTYLLDMGEPVKILELAEQVIRFSGYEPYKDVDIILTGLRKGERLDEPLWLEEEDPTPTEYPKILRLRSTEMGEKLQQLIDAMAPACVFDASRPELYRNADYLVQLLCDEVPSLKEFYDEQNK